jgi:hypothetical protein
MTDKGELHSAEPSAEIILPIISKVLINKSRELEEWKRLIDEKDKNMYGIKETVRRGNATIS